MARVLTEEHLWQIVNEPETHYTVLAERMNISREAVRLAQYRIRRHGWSCKIKYGTCRLCGKPVTLRVRSAMYAYHRQCRVEAVRIQKRAREDAAEVERRAEQFRNWLTTKQEESKSYASARGAAWTDEDDEVVWALMDRPVEETARRLGRTVLSVTIRRYRLRKKALRPAGATSDEAADTGTGARQAPDK